MKLDHQKRYSTQEIVDVVIIGTGAGGAPALATLAAAGASCVALEAGPNFDAEAFAFDEILADEIYWLDERLSAGSQPQAFGGNNSGRGVGGSTLHWGAFTPRADARDLKLRSDSGAGIDWPIQHEELHPFYEQVERFLGVSGPPTYPWDPKRRYPLPPLRRNAPAQTMAASCDRLGIRTADAPAAVVSSAWQRGHSPLRAGCIHCGFCHQGCRNGAKSSMDVTYLPVALHHGAEIRPNSRVHGFGRDRYGKITSVIYDHAGDDYSQPCRAVFLCAGAVETARLLLHTGIANSSDQVGRNYMGHVATQVWGTFDSEMRMNKGYPSSLISEDMIRPANAGFVGGYLMQSLGVEPVTWGKSVARGRGLWGQELVDYLKRYNHVAGIGINGETLPCEANRLTLSNDIDSIGVPKARIEFGYNDNEKRLNAHATKQMKDIWKQAGAVDIWALERVAHTLGTCRMGNSRDCAVVDRFGQSFDIENLWICDGSTFPSSLAANPALTIMALALRSAREYCRRAS